MLQYKSMTAEPELIKYIKKEQDRNTPEEKIREKLSLAGWKDEDIDSAFLDVSKNIISSIRQNKNTEENQKLSQKDIGTLFTPLKITEHDLSETKTIQNKYTHKKTDVLQKIIFITAILVVIIFIFFFFFSDYIKSLHDLIIFV